VTDAQAAVLAAEAVTAFLSRPRAREHEHVQSWAHLSTVSAWALAHVLEPDDSVTAGAGQEGSGRGLRLRHGAREALYGSADGSAGADRAAGDRVARALVLTARFEPFTRVLLRCRTGGVVVTVRVRHPICAPPAGLNPSATHRSLSLSPP